MRAAHFLIIAAILYLAPTAMADEQPFKQIPFNLPGRIEAVNYDAGGQGTGYSVTAVNGRANWFRQDGVDIESCADNGGYDLGWAAAGNWFRYSVNVPTAGKYTVAFRVAAGTDGGTLHLQNADGKNLTSAVVVHATGGWQVWSTVYASLELPAGNQVLTLVEDSGGYNIHYMNFDLGYLTPPAPTGLTASTGSRETTLLWTASSAAISYNVYRGIHPGAEAKIPIATGITDPNYTDTRLGSAVKYYYKVTAMALGKMSNASNEIAVAPQSSQASTPNFGPNVLIFDPAMPASTIQSQIDTIFSQQQANEFGTHRYAMLFKPGAYKAKVHVGFYTQVLGLGASPDDTCITGAVQADAAWFGGNATLNFWRGAENLAVVPTDGPSKWAVSQACPFRRMHVKGDMVLDDHGWSSGGFMSDSLIDGQVNSGSQQQWLTRNSTCGSWVGSNWNTVFVGVDNAPAQGAFPHPAYTVVNQSPIEREKPFLTIDHAGNYNVFVPAITTDSHGTTWAAGSVRGSFVPIGHFYIAHADTDTAATINAALIQGKNLLLTPGIYSLNDTLRVTRPNTIVLGLGLATLKPATGANAMEVADVDGVIIAGILFDAGPVSSPVLLQVGSPGSAADHTANPTSLHDVFFRVGGAGVGRAVVSLQINSNDVIGDDLWIWRADHSDGVGWNTNTAANGLIVNGERVTIYGLAVEHYQQYQTLWNGNWGRVYFYQSEAPYDVPDEGSWMNGNASGFASYKVADTVTNHKAWGLGIYCAFTNRQVALDSAIEAPKTSGVNFQDITTVSLGGAGAITHIVNDTGKAADRPSNVSRLSQYP
jgi:hypothetical protein